MVDERGVLFVCLAEWVGWNYKVIRNGGGWLVGWVKIKYGRRRTRRKRKGNRRRHRRRRRRGGYSKEKGMSRRNVGSVGWNM
jgi:hypothetical protein